jgi:transglutaminase-like putative cysteine protease
VPDADSSAPPTPDALPEPAPPVAPPPDVDAPPTESASTPHGQPGDRTGRRATIEAGIGIGWGTPSEVVLRVGVAHVEDVVVRSESLTIADQPLEPTVAADGSSLALLRTTGEQSWVAYRAEVDLVDRPPARRLTLEERLELTAPSRYCPSDVTAGFASATFGTSPPGHAIDTVAEWVHAHTAYQFGVSVVTTTALETLAAAAGVCRDFAHLTICLLRGLGVPARYVATYAPGLVPQDFHALVEAHDGDGWRLVDPTGLSDPTFAVRICSGRDGADVPFMAVLSGSAPVTDVVVDARLLD